MIRVIRVIKFAQLEPHPFSLALCQSNASVPDQRRGLQVGCQVANAKYSGHSCDRPIELFVTFR